MVSPQNSHHIHCLRFRREVCPHPRARPRACQHSLGWPHAPQQTHLRETLKLLHHPRGSNSADRVRFPLLRPLARGSQGAATGTSTT
eukprot:1230182-Rhodomonas_salina.3